MTIDNNGTAIKTYTYDNNACGSRLPCGVCMITGSRCPLVGWEMSPTWTASTTAHMMCGGDKHDD